MTTTPAIHRLLEVSEVEARALKHPSISSHHLLLGLVVIGDGASDVILRSMGLSRQSVLESIGRHGPSLDVIAGVEEFICDSSTVRVLRRAARGSHFLSHTQMGLEHILMSLLSERSGGAAGVFRDHNADTMAARRRLIRKCSWSVPAVSSGPTRSLE